VNVFLVVLVKKKMELVPHVKLVNLDDSLGMMVDVKIVQWELIPLEQEQQNVFLVDVEKNPLLLLLHVNYVDQDSFRVMMDSVNYVQ